MHFAWICDYPYVNFKKQLRLLAVPVHNGRPYYSHVWDTLSIGKPELTAALRVVAKSSEYGFV